MVQHEIIPERIVQELVPGKEISIAHIIAGPDDSLYDKLGLKTGADTRGSAIGLLTVSPPETAIIAADVAVKASGVTLGFLDRVHGTLLVTGAVSDTEAAIQAVINYVRDKMGFSVCEITRT
uniref:BMC circularly permuted domain-containing protein n=1 Tax=Eubacterium plexicaudatum ASF492 TaxID=1235802 RepID=N2AP02_9FIRM